MNQTTRPANYRQRVIDAELAEALSAAGAVLLEGPRGCGKTATATIAARSQVRLDVDEAMRQAGLVAPQLLLTGDRPRLIDEWQLVPAVWDHVRRAVDDNPDEVGHFILTGSAVPEEVTERHTGGMRILRLRMRPMSLAESGHSTQSVSLAGLMAGETPAAMDPGLDIHALAERIAVGGWPGLISRTPDQVRRILVSYLEDTRRIDLVRVDGVRRDPENVGRVLRSLARHIATQTSARAIAADVSGSDQAIKEETVADYIRALTRVFIEEDLPAWSPALRSRVPHRRVVKRHFVDPSLAVAALGATPARLVQDVETMGFLLESMVVRDLRVHAQAIGARVFYYGDDSGLEADAIVEDATGRWGAFEVKLGQSQVDEAAAHLLEVARRVDPEKHGGPAVLAVVTGWGPAYRRSDGVCVVPIGALGP